jgi:CubicO group peptidase (beta-lactamase class C family)
VTALEHEVEQVAEESRFSGVVRVDVAGETVLARAFGFADRAHEQPNTVATRIGIASGSKGFTALTVVRLIELGVLGFDTPARSLLGDDLPLIDDGVTVEHLLGHRSGIGDYIDEDDDGDITDHVLPLPVHRLATTEGFVAVLDGHATKFEPDTRFSYCNGGFVVLALLAERAAGQPFHDLVAEHVLDPAGMTATAYLRMDELPGDAAVGYLVADGLRSNVLHLPVRANGDGGAFTTAGDVHTFWGALFAGRIVSPASLEAMVRLRSDVPGERLGYGLGFWLDRERDAVVLEGFDAGASFRSVHRPSTATTWTVMSNWSNGAWPLARQLTERF